MTLDQIVAIADIAAVVLSSAAMIFGFYVRATAHAAVERRGVAIETKIEGLARALYERINADHDRISQLEGKIDDMPRVSDVHALSLQISAMAGDLKAIGVKMGNIEEANKGYRGAISRIENHLFEVRT
jgi:hypothetical protein